MFANGASAIATCMSYIDERNTIGGDIFLYFYYILNWFGLLVLTITLIHVADLQHKYQLIDSNPYNLRRTISIEDKENYAVTDLDEERNHIRVSINLDKNLQTQMVNADLIVDTNIVRKSYEYQALEDVDINLYRAII